jgi:hypothetical protein
VRSDEQLLNDEVESARTGIYETAARLYDAIGPSAVHAFGFRLGLRTQYCEPCEQLTPTIGDRSYRGACLVCGTVDE